MAKRLETALFWRKLCFFGFLNKQYSLDLLKQKTKNSSQKNYNPIPEISWIYSLNTFSEKSDFSLEIGKIKQYFFAKIKFLDYLERICAFLARYRAFILLI